MRLRFDVGVVLVLGELGVVDTVAGEGKLLLGGLVAPVAVRKEPGRHGDGDRNTQISL